MQEKKSLAEHIMLGIHDPERKCMSSNFSDIKVKF